LEQLLSSTPGNVPAALEHLAPYRETLRPRIYQLLSEGNQVHRLRAACALVQGATSFEEHTVRVITDLVPDLQRSEFPNVVAALRRFPDESTRLLADEFRAAGLGIQQSRLATLELCLGGQSLLKEISANWAYPDSATDFVMQFADWYAGGIDFATLFDQSMPEDSLFVLLVALGRIPPSALDLVELNELQRRISDVYQFHPDSGVHSAAGWTLERWNAPRPDLEAEPDPPADRDWWVAAIGPLKIELIRVPRGSFIRGEGGDASLRFPWYSVEKVEVEDEIWMSAREVPFALVRSWMESSEGDAVRRRLQQSPDLAEYLTESRGTLPCHGFSFLDAAQFANSLSLQTFANGRANPDRWQSYESTGEDLALQRDRYGIRLPTPDEWEYACRAGSSTRFYWGNHSAPAICREFAVFDDGYSPERHPKTSGTKIPNRWGLFDMLGNVSELCRDYPDQETGQMRCFNRGGNCRRSLRTLVTAHVQENRPSDVTTFQGMRLVLQLPPAE
jgi:formylglycine-generating enzyme required for sulfatase activity